MARNLIQQIMEKSAETNRIVDRKALIEKINSGYTINRITKQTQKKTFAPSTLAYGHGECARYWYLAFDGQEFDDYADEYSAANMTAGTKAHERIQEAMSNVPGLVVESEFKITYPDPPIFGYGDTMINWEDEQLLIEIKTVGSEGFEYRKMSGKPKVGHLIQLLIYMKILKKSKAVLLYENKNNHDLVVIPVEVSDSYRAWADYAFNWMREVRKAWVDRNLPTNNYRSNSKICKTCPVKRACDAAGEGVIKIKSLEEPSEVM